MIHDFCVYHRAEQGSPRLELPPGHWAMGTCLRSLVFSEAHEERPALLASHRRYKGAEAFALVLQIVCGLHSPLVGETEVFGQFKNFVKANREALPPSLLQVFELLLQEAKKIRSQHLQGLGCTSYGSLLRKHMQGERRPLVFLGAGSLTRDILPWCLKEGAPVRILTRNPEQHLDLQSEAVRVESYAQATQVQGEGAVLIVAAPLSAEQIAKDLPLTSFQQIFDLRGESLQNPLTAGNVTPLHLFFQDLAENRRRAEAAKAQALEDIDQRSQQLQLMERPRPFGWEDLWTYS